MLVENNNEILALAPLVYSKYSLFGLGNFEKISFAGTPETDYTDFIIKGKKKKYLELLFDYLNKHYEWDYINLKDIPETTASINLLRKSLKKRVPYYKERVCVLCPYLPLPNSMEGFMIRLSKNMRGNLRKKYRKLRDKYRIRLKRYDEIGSIKEAMKIFFNLHQKRLKVKEIFGDFMELKKSHRNFYVDIAENFAKKDWLGLYFLTSDDEPIATLFGFEYGEKMYSYLPAWNPEYYRYSVGNLMHMIVIEECIRRGFKEYDMMRGDVQNKNRFATINRKNIEISIIRKGLSLHLRTYDWLIEKKTFIDLSMKLGLSLTNES